MVHLDRRRRDGGGSAMTDRDPAERFRPSGASPDAPRPMRRLARAAVALGMMILLGFLVIRVSVANALLQLGPDAAAMVSREHPEALLRRSLNELLLSGEVSGETKAAALSAFRSAPLSEVPLLIAAREMRARGDDSRADQLLAIAIRRNPRSRYALLVQLERDLRLGRDRDAAVRMAVLSRLVSDAGPLLVGELARMAADPDTRASAAHVMASDPRLRVAVLEALASQRADPEVVLGLAGPVSTAVPGAEVPRWQRILLDGMVERGELERAFAVWTRLAGPAATSRDGLYDPDFQGMPGPPPFNWVLETSGDGFAERTTDGLNAEYYGRNNVNLASQLILLAPGRYEISFEAEGQSEGDESPLSWTVSCRSGSQLLVAVPITGVEFTPRRYAGAFTVTPGCDGQWLRLVGDAAEFPKQQQVTIRRLRIARAGR